MTESIFRKFVYLTDIPLFVSLTAAEEEVLARGSFRQRVAKNTPILRRGAAAPVVGVVLSGCLRAAMAGEEGQEFLYHFYLAGDLFGEPLVESAGSPCDVIAETDAEILLVSQTTVRNLALRNPDFTVALVEHLAWLVARHRERLNGFALHTGQGRILHYLASLAQQFGNADGEVPLRLSHQDIAGACGLARETASRLINQLQRQGVIARSSNGWRVVK